MKLITAFIQPFMLDRIARQLRSAHVSAFAVSEARLYGPNLADASTAYEEKMRLDVPVEDDKVDSTFELIHHIVESDEESDFLLYVTELQKYILD